MKKTRGHTSAVQVAIACIIMNEHSPKACETNNGGLIFDASEPDDIPWRDMTLILSFVFSIDTLLFSAPYPNLLLLCP